MRKIVILPATLSLLALAGPASALDPADEAALLDTQAMLSDQQAMAAFAQGNPEALKALSQMDQLTGGDPRQKQEMSGISSAIFADMMRSSGGDSAAVLGKLQNALKDPQGFMNSLSPEQQKRIRALAAEIEEKNALAGNAENKKATP